MGFPNWSCHFCLEIKYCGAPDLKSTQLIVPRFSHHSSRTKPGSRNKKMLMLIVL